MPTDQRVGFHDCQDTTPLDQVRQRDERKPTRVVGTAWLHLPLHAQRELLPQEQVLGDELGMRLRRLRNKPHSVTDETQDRTNSSGRSGPAVAADPTRVP